MELSEYNEVFLENIIEFFPKIRKVLEMIIAKHEKIIDEQPHAQSKERDAILTKHENIISKYRDLIKQSEGLKFDVLTRSSVMTSMGFLAVTMQQKAIKLTKHELPLQVRQELSSILRTINNLATFWGQGTEVSVLTDDEVEKIEREHYERLKKKYDGQEELSR